MSLSGRSVLGEKISSSPPPVEVVRITLAELAVVELVGAVAS
jgi:hypothetical protein